jgi:transposase
MTITELTPRRKDREPVQRFEVFTGAGRRREWGEDEKRQIVEESHSSDLSVCAVARRHGLSPSQLFAWRRAAREHQQERAELLPMFVLALVASPEAPRKNKARRPLLVKSSSRAAAVEMEIGDIKVKVSAGADCQTIAAVLNALKASQ